MRTLFLDKTRPSTRRWVLLVGALALVEAAALTAYMLRPVPVSIDQALATPQQHCAARGEQHFTQAGEWPTTHDGRDTPTLVNARCTLDPEAFR